MMVNLDVDSYAKTSISQMQFIVKWWNMLMGIGEN